MIPRRVIITRTSAWSSMSCRLSRSPVTTSTGSPSSLASLTRVAIRSSASYPATSTTGIRKAASTSRTSGIWELKSSGVVRRLAL